MTGRYNYDPHFEDDGPYADDLASHHAAGAAEARAEDEWENEDEE